MFFSLLAGFLFSGLISISAINPAVKAEVLFFGESSQLRVAVESIDRLPENTYKDFYSENFLPENKGLIPWLKDDVPLENFSIYASSALAIDVTSGKVLYSSGADNVRSIASLSKLATALTFLDLMPEWGNFYKIKKSDLRSGGKSYIYEGDEVKIIDLFHLSLMASDNSATVALGSALGFSEVELAAKMNAKAMALGLVKTHFTDVTGLSYENVSTAKEVAVLAKKSFARKSIREVVLKRDYSFSTAAGRVVEVFPTDYLLSVLPQENLDILGGKTGYTVEAGYCFAGEFFQNNKKIISVVLGAPTDLARFQEAKKLAEWVFASFSWK
ncbi:MAG: serine hydrolase [Patescibacteria group bacterium]|jgi:D-alanyl-D-alanine endopeptidase (penicillin-binding protein 7)